MEAGVPGRAMGDQPVDSDGERNNLIANALVAEFNSLRAEIAGRSGSQQLLVNLSLTMVGLVLGIAFSQRAGATIILVIPIFASCCAMLYFDHAAQITKIGRYIGYILRPRLAEIVDDDKVLAWESSYLTFQREPEATPFQYGIPTFVLFVGGPLSVCVASLAVVHQIWHWLAWSVGMALELVSAYLWIVFIRRNNPAEIQAALPGVSI
jgi:hypothetical protein